MSLLKPANLYSLTTNNKLILQYSKPKNKYDFTAIVAPCGNGCGKIVTLISIRYLLKGNLK